MHNICEIEDNLASGYSGREPYANRRTDGGMDGRHVPYHNTTDFRQSYKKVVTDVHTDRWMDGQRLMEKQTDELPDGLTDGWTDIQIYTDREMDRHPDR